MKNREQSTLEQQQGDASSQDTFLQRWSKRKLESTLEEETDERLQGVMPDERQSETGNHTQSAGERQVELTDEDMPPLDSLDENSDYSSFFSPKVSESLRQQALRKLFHFQQFNIVDDLNDYNDDFTQLESLGNVVTHEMKRLLDLEKQKLKADQPSETLAQNQQVDEVIQAENTDNSKARDNREELKQDKVTES